MPSSKDDDRYYSWDEFIKNFPMEERERARGGKIMSIWCYPCSQKYGNEDATFPVRGETFDPDNQYSCLRCSSKKVSIEVVTKCVCGHKIDIHTEKGCWSEGCDCNEWEPI